MTTALAARCVAWIVGGFTLGVVLGLLLVEVATPHHLDEVFAVGLTPVAVAAVVASVTRWLP